MLRRYLEHIRETVAARKEAPSHSCHFATPERAFFTSVVRMDALRGTGMNDCQKVALLLLGKLLPDHEARHYAFDRKVSHGTTGYVFACHYRGEAKRVLKVVFLEGGRSPPGFRRVHRTNFERECRVQRRLSEAWRDHRHLRAPRIYAHGIATSVHHQVRLGIMVMELVPTSGRRLLSWPGMIRDARARDVLSRATNLPRVIYSLQKEHVLHNDLHPGNIIFPSSEGDRMVVIDFGRTMMRGWDRRLEGDRASLARVTDMLVPLFSLLLSETAGEAEAERKRALYDAYMGEARGLIAHTVRKWGPLPPLAARVVAELTDDGGTWERRITALNTLLKDRSSLYPGGVSWLDMMEARAAETRPPSTAARPPA